MKEYHIRWTIELDAENPRDALKRMLEMVTLNDDVFTVTDSETGEETVIDLAEDS